MLEAEGGKVHNNRGLLRRIERKIKPILVVQ